MRLLYHLAWISLACLALLASCGWLNNSGGIEAGIPQPLAVPQEGEQ